MLLVSVAIKNTIKTNLNPFFNKEIYFLYYIVIVFKVKYLMYMCVA